MALTCDDLGLSKDNLLCDAALSLVQLLTDAGNDTQTVLQSVGCLLPNELTPQKIASQSWARLFFPLTKHMLHTQIVAIKKIRTFLNYLITLSKDVAPLRVAQDHPGHATVFDHRRAADDISDRKHYSNTHTHLNPACVEDSKGDRSEQIYDGSESFLAL